MISGFLKQDVLVKFMKFEHFANFIGISIFIEIEIKLKDWTCNLQDITLYIESYI